VSVLGPFHIMDRTYHGSHLSFERENSAEPHHRPRWMGLFGPGPGPPMLGRSFGAGWIGKVIRVECSVVFVVFCLNTCVVVCPGELLKNYGFVVFCLKACFVVCPGKLFKKHDFVVCPGKLFKKHDFIAFSLKACFVVCPGRILKKHDFVVCPGEIVSNHSFARGGCGHKTACAGTI
jgi:hypothetical protein